MDGDLRDVMLGWLLNWCNCPDKGLHGEARERVEAAKEAAGDGASALFGATRQDMERALDEALAEFPELCPDVPEERRLRMAARLARVLEGDRLRHLLGGPVYTAPPARVRRNSWIDEDDALPGPGPLDEENEEAIDEERDDELDEELTAEEAEVVEDEIAAPAAELPAVSPVEGSPDVAPAPRHLAAGDTLWGPLWGPEPEAGTPGPRAEASVEVRHPA